LIRVGKPAIKKIKSTIPLPLLQLRFYSGFSGDL